MDTVRSMNLRLEGDWYTAQLLLCCGGVAFTSSRGNWVVLQGWGLDMRSPTRVTFVLPGGLRGMTWTR